MLKIDSLLISSSDRLAKALGTVKLKLRIYFNWVISTYSRWSLWIWSSFSNRDNRSFPVIEINCFPLLTPASKTSFTSSRMANGTVHSFLKVRAASSLNLMFDSKFFKHPNPGSKISWNSEQSFSHSFVTNDLDFDETELTFLKNIFTLILSNWRSAN